MHVYILLDRSGSMESLWDEALSSINTYVRDLAADTKVTLAVFDDYAGVNYIKLRDKVKSQAWPQVTRTEVAPRGGTPLFDAAGKMLNEMIENDHRKAIFVCMTDGFENASKEFNKAQITAKVEQAKKNDWGIVFLGADFSKVGDSAGAIGISTGSTVNWRKGMFDVGTQYLNVKTASYAAAAEGQGYATMDSWTDEEKAKVEGK